jgi:hypothetical protein
MARVRSHPLQPQAGRRKWGKQARGHASLTSFHIREHYTEDESCEADVGSSQRNIDAAASEAQVSYGIFGQDSQVKCRVEHLRVRKPVSDLQNKSRHLDSED